MPSSPAAPNGVSRSADSSGKKEAFRDSFAAELESQQPSATPDRKTAAKSHGSGLGDLSPSVPHAVSPAAPEQNPQQNEDDDTSAAEDGETFSLNSKKPEDRDDPAEVDLSNTQMAGQTPVVKSETDRLPFALTLSFAFASAKQGTEPEKSDFVGQSSGLIEAASGADGQVPALAPLSPPDAKPTTGDKFSLMERVEMATLTSAPKLVELQQTTIAPKSGIAFEARLRPNEFRTESIAPTPNPVNSPAQRETAPTNQTDGNYAAATAAKVGPSAEVSQSAEATGAVTSQTEAKPSRVTRDDLDGRQQDRQDSKDRKPASGEASSTPAARHAGDSAQQQSPVPTTQHATKTPEAAAPVNRADRLTAPAHEIPEAAQPRTEPVRDISFRIASSDANPVDIKLTERAGEIRVAVHSADPALTRSLQSNVTELAGKLERSGFHAETVIPNRAEPARESQANQNFQDAPKERRAPLYEQHRPKKRFGLGGPEFQIDMLQTVNQEKS